MPPSTHRDTFYEGKTSCFTFTFYLSFFVRAYPFVGCRRLFSSRMCFVVRIRYNTFFAISSSFFFFHVNFIPFFLCILLLYKKLTVYWGAAAPHFLRACFHETIGVFTRKDSNLLDWSFDLRIFVVLTKKRKPFPLFCTCFFVSSQTRNTYNNETDY